jgi:hypothetical protein
MGPLSFGTAVTSAGAAFPGPPVFCGAPDPADVMAPWTSSYYVGGRSLHEPSRAQITIIHQDTYCNFGQAGAFGAGSRAHGNTFQQTNGAAAGKDDRPSVLRYLRSLNEKIGVPLLIEALKKAIM